MIKIEYLFCISAAFLTTVVGLGDMGPGSWRLLSIGPCDEEATTSVEFKCQIDAARRKHNRTLDVFDVTVDCEEDLDDSFGIFLTICQHVDGGCKEWQVLSDDSFPRFGKKYADDNLKRAMEMAGNDPPEFPLAAGSHKIKDYVINYCEFPRECVYGTFTGIGYLLKNGVKVACLKGIVQFDEDTEGYECE